jgi:magnesium transporter
VPTASADELVRSVLDRLQEANPRRVDLVCVVDGERRLSGVASLADLLAAAPDRPIGHVASTSFPVVGPNVDQEEVAHAAIGQGAAAVVVVDAAGRVLGVVPAQALIAILYQEHAEDLHRLAGIRREVAHARDAIEAPPMRRAHDRLPWLIIGLLGSTLATLVVARFQRALEARVAIAFFVPGLVYLADAIGTQTEAVIVRGLSLSRTSLRHLLLNEVVTGLLIGLVLAALTYPAVLLAFASADLALAVSTALVAAAGVATSIGLLLPWLLARLGSDPAFGSGPLATIIQDVLSLLIYFTLASWLAL